MIEENPVKTGAGRPYGSTKKRSISEPIFKLKIEVSQVQAKQLNLMVQRGDGKSAEGIIEAWISAELTKRREAGRIAPEATIFQLDNKEKNSAENTSEQLSNLNKK